MSEKFVASNRVEISRSGKGVYDHESRRSISMSEGEVDALREFFRHERDEELGRWRSSIHPSWTAVEDGRVYRFTNDDGKRGFDVHKEDRSYTGWLGELREVAKEFLGAHPASNPWHDAEPGEVWVLATDMDGEFAFTVVQRDGFNAGVLSFAPVGEWHVPYLGYRAPAITAGRRIFPEATDA